MHRFLWDMHYAPVPGIAPGYPIAAIPHNTAPQATSPWAMPGQYTVVMNIGGKTYTQPLTVRMDPRVKTAAAGLQQQFNLSYQMYAQLLKVSPAFDQIVELRRQLSALQKRAQGDTLVAVNTLDQKLRELAGGGGGRRPGPAAEAPSIGGMRTRLVALMGIFQEADVAPTTQAAGAAPEVVKSVVPVLARWDALRAQDVPALNAKLRAANLPELKLASNPPSQETEENEE